MDRKIKLATAVSLLAVTASACTPNPYYTGYNYGTGTATTQTRTATTQTSGVVNRAAVTHTHCGRTHSHPLPPEGLAHHHGDGCLAGSGGATTTAANTTPAYNNYAYTQPQQPAATYTYTAPVTTPYYDYSAGTTTSTSSNYDYSGYTAPKTTTTNTYRSTTPPAAASGDVYTVQKGDTVFQVMRNTGVYWKDIIRLNNLRGPDYTITPGQTLRLR